MPPFLSLPRAETSFTKDHGNPKCKDRIRAMPMIFPADELFIAAGLFAALLPYENIMFGASYFAAIVS
jgi:hypothetical protein